MAKVPKYVGATLQKEYTDCRIVHLLVLPKFQYIIMDEINNANVNNVHPSFASDKCWPHLTYNAVTSTGMLNKCIKHSSL